ncbi:hypothetical protein A6V39_04420 [Candidatus Mycoplasma haematobovis]|uniref:Uncharacterized protein n=1 Tax=Candidatus Mycoplasma haematobovis TaxID=432608 RepID=A0A1A9QEK8_9MOLU|nr:hypothetical protein [Candidatus Mycoplasma haematobovis]OAL10129.1 hypothetical protein A6V39_04420 [Candidatus Mycoplasma haematobovis]
MKGTAWVALGVGGAGSIAGTGLAINHVYGGTSIKEYIETNKESKNKIFLTSKTPALSEIQGKYKTSKRTKPQKNGKDVPETELGQWCEDAVKGKFSDENSDIYKQIISWCYINTNSLKDELTKNGKVILSGEAEGHNDWKVAWGKYNSRTDKESFKINEASYEALNQSDEVAGGKALHKWCNAKKDETKKLYEDGMEDVFALFVKWCAK